MIAESGRPIRTLVAPVALLLLIAAPCGAQISGMPVWNRPGGVTGVELSADAGFPRDQATVLALRAGVGLGAINLNATVGRQNSGDDPKMKGVTAGLRLFGGGLSPVAMNAQAGYADGDDETSAYSRYTMALGLGLHAPIPGLGLEPWVSPGFRIMHRSGEASGTDTNFGVAAGLRATFGLLGVHAGVDRESTGGGKGLTTVGVGVHVGLGLPGS